MIDRNEAAPRSILRKQPIYGAQRVGAVCPHCKMAAIVEQ